MTFEQFKKSICDKDPQVKWALDLIDEEVKEALQQQREEITGRIKDYFERQQLLFDGKLPFTFFPKEDTGDVLLAKVYYRAVEDVLRIINPPRMGRVRNKRE